MNARGAGRRVALGAAVSAALVLVALPRPLAAQFTLVQGDAATLTVGGYLRSITGLHDLGFDPPSVPGVELARQSGFHSEVVRVKWLLDGGTWRLELHDRLQARVTSQAGLGSGAAGGGGQVVGFGVSAVPDRLVDLRSDFVDRDRLDVWHDVDRLSLSVYSDAVDITVGRQAITWGTSTLFPVADLWAQFSPFEQDTEEKPGLDAVRALFYPTAGLEVDAVVAHRGSAEDLSAGVRATLGLPAVDVWAGGGKFWREMLTMGGVTVLLDEVKLRAEAVVPYDLDARALRDPRATAGVDWIRGTLVVSGEYHFNGIGAGEPERYVEASRDARFLRGETYYLGRHYLGGLASWSPDAANRLTLALSTLVNLGDGSAAFTPTASYDLGQATRVAIGGLLSAGPGPEVSLAPPAFEPRSEFGTYGDLLFTTVSVYF